MSFQTAMSKLVKRRDVVSDVVVRHELRVNAFKSQSRETGDLGVLGALFKQRAMCVKVM